MMNISNIFNECWEVILHANDNEQRYKFTKYIVNLERVIMLMTVEHPELRENILSRCNEILKIIK